MIQRLQTVWLLLAAVFAFLYTRVPIYVTRVAGNVVTKYLPTESLLLFAVSIATALLAAACIFLYKNRPFQFKLSVIGFLLSLGIIALEVWQVGQLKTSNVLQQSPNALVKGSYSWGALLPIAMCVFFWMAAGRIRKDEKLIKSLDRLR
jgi:hypothetical protein